MITNDDWKKVNEQMMEADRLRLGDPPTDEELLAYSRGELSPEATERVRELLVAYPEMARAMTEPILSQNGQPVERDATTDAKLERRWRELQARLHGEDVEPQPKADAKVLRFWRRASAALAAALVVAFGGLLWFAAGRSQPELRPQAVGDHQLLLPDGRRGGPDDATTLRASGDSYVLVAPLVSDGGFDEFRFDLAAVDGDTVRVMWQSPHLRRNDEEPFVVIIPRALLRDGRYRLMLYGVGGAREEQLATYTVRVAPR